MKRICSILILILIGFIFGSSINNNVIAEQSYPLKIWAQNENGKYHTFVVIDDNTGVNYIVVSSESVVNGPISIAITPRLLGDGKLYITK